MRPTMCQCDRSDGRHATTCPAAEDIRRWVKGDGDGLPVSPDAQVPLAAALAAVRMTCGVDNPMSDFAYGWHAALMEAEGKLRKTDPATTITMPESEGETDTRLTCEALARFRVGDDSDHSSPLPHVPIPLPHVPIPPPHVPIPTHWMPLPAVPGEDGRGPITQERLVVVTNSDQDAIQLSCTDALASDIDTATVADFIEWDIGWPPEPGAWVWEGTRRVIPPTYGDDEGGVKYVGAWRPFTIAAPLVPVPPRRYVLRHDVNLLDAADGPGRSPVPAPSAGAPRVPEAAQRGNGQGSQWETAGPGNVCGHCGQAIGEGFACTRAEDGTPFHEQCPVEGDVGPYRATPVR